MEFKVYPSSQENIETVDQEALATVLDVLGHPEAWVSDESQVRDFQSYCFEMSEEDKAEAIALETYHLAKLEALTGRVVTIHDYIWEVARDVAIRRNSVH